MSAPAARKTSAAVAVPGTDASVPLEKLSPLIAMELAAGLSNAEAIRDRYGITEQQWKTLAANGVFRNMLADAIQKVRGDLNAGARIQLKADIVLEEAIPVYDRMIHDAQIPAQARIEAGKLVKELAGRGSKQAEGGGGSGFVLNINLGARTVTIDGSATPVPAEASE
jgi:hypothetical protein